MGVALLIPALFAISETAANVVVDADPQLASTLAPGSGEVLAARAKSEFTLKPSADDGSLASALARKALLNDPTAVDAVIVLGQQAALRGEVKRAERLMQYADSLSRRELRAHLWSIEEAVARGDIKGAVARYDLAMRTSRTAPEVLFPPLRRGIQEELVSQAFIEVFKENGEWAPAFFENIGKNPDYPIASARFLTKVSDEGLAVQRSAKTDLVNALFEAGNYDEAWALFVSMVNGAQRVGVQNGTFQEAPNPPSRLDWQIVNDDGVYTSLIPRKDGGVLEFQARASTDREVAFQFLLLNEGTYHFSALGEIYSGDFEQLKWSLMCLKTVEVGSISARQKKGGRLSFEGVFSIPDKCSAQKLTLKSSSRNRNDPLVGNIQKVMIVELVGPD
ncbi:MAG: hypothetical protein WBA51_08690 [Erythrobacter sp.]